MKKINTLANLAFIVIMIPLIFFAAFMIVASILGWKFNPVMSGSMDPVFKVGDVVATQQIDPDGVEVGDIITYRSPQLGKVVVHRVIEKQEGDQLSFITKGDANESSDPYPVPAENVLSKVGFHIPALGLVSQFVTSGQGILLCFVIPGLLIVSKQQAESIRTRFSGSGKRREVPVTAESCTARQAWTTGLGAREDWIKDQNKGLKPSIHRGAAYGVKSNLPKLSTT